MPKGYSLEYNDFSGGLNTRLPASQIARNEAQVAVNVDLRSGALKSIKDLGTAISSSYLITGASVLYSGKNLHYAASSYFMDEYSFLSGYADGNPSSFNRRYLDDGDVTYFTNSSNYPQKAVAASPLTPVNLGVVAPDPPTVTKVSGALSGRFKYALTFFTSDDIESNPTFFADVSLSSQGIQFTLPIAKNARIVGARLYRTRESEDVYFLIRETLGVSTSSASITVTSDTTSDSDIDVESQLTWAQGGFPSSGGQYIEDHSPPPALSVLSNRLHAGNSSGKPGAGIVFGALGADLRWSILGAPDYWPVVNQATLPGVCEALVSVSGTTFAFTATGIFQLIGPSDDAINVTQTNAAHGVKPGTGHLVTDTPFGMMYQSPEGIALFNGSSSTIVSSGKLALATIEAYTYNSAAFYDNQLFLFHSAGALIADFQDGVGGVRFWNYTSTDTVYSGAVATFDAPVVAEPFSSPLGVIDEVFLTDGGDGYTALPTGSVAAPTNGAAAAVSFSASVSRILITNAGSGYTTPPEVTFSTPAGGTPAKARAFIVNGQVVSIEVTDPGSGYTSVPTATIAGGGGGSSLAVTVWCTLTGARLTQTGFGFSTIQKIVLAGGTLASGGRAAVAYGSVATLGLYQHASIRVGTKLFVFGGLAHTKAAVDNNVGGPSNVGLNVIPYGQYYDTTTKTWTLMAPISSGAGRHSFSCVTDGSTYIYVWSGSETTADTATSTTLRRYDISANTWSTIATTLYGGTGNAGASSWFMTHSGTNYMYVWGGFDAGGARDLNLYRLNLSTNAWASISASSAYPYAAVAVSGANVFVIGGRDTQTTTYNGGGTATQSWLSVIKVTPNATLSSTTFTGGVTDTGYRGRDSATAVPMTIAGTSYVLLYGGQNITASSEFTLSALLVYDINANSFTKNVQNIVGLPELRGHTMTTLADNSIVIYGGVSEGTERPVAGTGYRFSPQAAFDPASVTTLYVATGTAGNASVKPWAQGSTYLPMQWRGREETSPLPGQQHVMTRFRLDYEGDPQLSIFADGTEEPGGGSFFFDGASSASRTQARQWLPSASSTRPDGRRLSVQFKSPSAAGNDTVVYRFEVDGKTDGS